jgi:HD-like signal output (HDOD) protein
MTIATVPQIDFKKILSKAQLPGLPQSAIRIMELSQDPNKGPADIAVPVEVDPGLTGQVLRFVNSSYFGFARKISSVKMAVILLGIRTIQSFTLWSAVYDMMTNPKFGLFYLKSLWQDSLRRALFARRLAKAFEMEDVEEVFAASLLQDIAVPILAKEMPQEYLKLLEARNQGHVRLSTLEYQAFGWSHAQAASMMARNWKLPDDFSSLIEDHIEIKKYADQTKIAPDKAAVAMSALLPSIADPVWTECRQFASYYEKIMPGKSPTILESLGQIDMEYEQIAPVIKLEIPAKSLVESYNEATESDQLNQPEI